MTKKYQRRSASKRSRTSNNDTPSVPNDGDDNNNAPQSKASSMLNSKMVTLSLSNKVKTNINENAILMQTKFKETHQRSLASAKISAQDQDGARPIVRSAKADKQKHCPITVPKRFQDDKEMKEIQEADDKLVAKYEEDKSDLIRKNASRITKLLKEELREKILQALRALATDVATHERVIYQITEFKYVPTNVTDIDLGNAAAMEYISTNVQDDAAKRYKFESSAAFKAAYAELHGVHVPVPQEPPVLTQATLAQPETMEVEEVPLKDNEDCKHILTKTKNTINDLWPLMTTPFWEEYIQDEIHRTVDRDVGVRTRVNKQEEANHNVSINFDELQDDLKDDPKKFVSTLAEAVSAHNKEEEQKAARKKASRKKSSGESKKNQATAPTKNGQSGGKKSKQNSKKGGQQQQNTAKSSNNNSNNTSKASNRNSNNGGGRGRGRNHPGGRGNGRGGGRGGRGRT